MSFIIHDKDQFLQRAKKQGDEAPEEFGHLVELYYIARYFVALFEARNHEIPLQVWNEYRNTLDHFFRHLTNTSDNSEKDSETVNHLDAMKNHLTRAVLDIIKINCHESDKWLHNELNCHEKQALLLIDNGLFLTSINKQIQKAKTLFIEAKVNDYDFGKDKTENRRIVAKYLDAVFAYDNIRNEIDNKTEEILIAERNYSDITNSAEANTNKKSFLKNVWASLTASVIWIIATSIITVIITKSLS